MRYHIEDTAYVNDFYIIEYFNDGGMWFILDRKDCCCWCDLEGGHWTPEGNFLEYCED